MCIRDWVNGPMLPVPMTLQTLAVLAIGAAYGARLGAITLALYALEGAAGLPVFAEFKSGFMLASFGYVLGFILAAALVGWLAERGLMTAHLRIERACQNALGAAEFLSTENPKSLRCITRAWIVTRSMIWLAGNLANGLARWLVFGWPAGELPPMPLLPRPSTFHSVRRSANSRRR